MNRIKLLLATPTAKVLLLSALAGAAFALRIRGVAGEFWMMEDQTRDWSIALQPFWALPLVGPPTHVSGYTIGPAFYWVLWAIRVVFGPFFSNLPHAGGIGQAVLHTSVDILLLVAVRRRLGSWWVALALFVLVVTGPLDLALAGLVWNPTMGTTLAKTALALLLLNWHRRSLRHLAVVAAVAWASIHAYTGAVFVALSVLLALLVDEWQRMGRRQAVMAATTIAGVICALQVPYVIHQIATRFDHPAMGAVTGGITEILAGRSAPLWRQSLEGYAFAVATIQAIPLGVIAVGGLLLVSSLATALLFRRDLPLLLVVLLPQAAAIVGYSFFLNTLDPYYYLSLLPSVALAVLAPFALVPGRRVRVAVGVALLAFALAVVPARAKAARTNFRLPAYRVMVDASRTLVRLRQPLRDIRVSFPLPPSCDPKYPFFVLGGRLDPQAPWIAVIGENGHIEYLRDAI